MIEMNNIKMNEYFKKSFWFLMAIQAGFVNTGGIILCNSYVSHVTGFGTQIGVSFAKKNYWMAIEMICVPFFFILGSFYSSFFISRRKILGLPPKQVMVTATKCLIFLLVLVLGVNGVWGNFGLQMLTEKNFLIIPFLCFVCGIQNSTCAQLTNGVLRPTHLTGLATDIGIAMAKLPSLKSMIQSRTIRDKRSKISGTYKAERNLLLTRLGVLFSFFLGAAVAFPIFHSYEYWAFLFPFLCSLFFCFLAWLDQFQEKKGSHWQWGETLASSFYISIITILAILGITGD
jgi:uncharacterized membrane protein YoaK (UPF0700 family)